MGKDYQFRFLPQLALEVGKKIRKANTLRAENPLTFWSCAAITTFLPHFPPCQHQGIH